MKRKLWVFMSIMQVQSALALRGFFRRSMLRQEEYKCIGNGQCEITLAKRNGCPYCRYNKCLAVGMSKNAIKTGRYTHRKITQDILEIQKIKDGRLTDKEDEASIPSFPEPLAQPSCSDEANEKLLKQILEAHHKHIRSTLTISDETLEKEQQAYYEQHKLKIDIFGPMATLPREQYDEFYQTTGIDIDNRQDMMRIFAATMETGLQRYVTFVKTVPGFSLLSSDDQANLIKSARFEFFYFGSFRGYNNRLKILSMSSGKCLHINELAKLWEEDFLLAVFKFSDSLKTLNLSVEECILIKTMCVFFTDRCELQNLERIEEIQHQITNTLIHLLKKHHSSPMLRFAKIVDRLTSVRNLTEWNRKIAKNMYLWPSVQKSPLLLDMLAM